MCASVPAAPVWAAWLCSLGLRSSLVWGCTLLSPSLPLPPSDDIVHVLLKKSHLHEVF